MLELDIIGAWDARAVNLDQEEADRNVYEFDLTLWNLLSTLAKERPDDAASQFSLGMDTVQKLSLATPSQLEALASGVLISFKLETAEQNIITRLSGDYDPVVFINHSVDEFDAAYWLLFNRVASRDPEMAKEVFGVSRELAELVAKATDSQLRHMSGTTVTHFTLRFAPSIIEEILDDSREELTHPVLKNCNSLYRDVGGGDEHWQLWYIGSLGYSSTHGPCWVHHKNHHDRDWPDLQTGQTALPDLERDGYTLERKSRTFRGGATLIHSHTSKIQASLLMQLYFNIGGEAVLRSVNIKALNKAFRMYHAIRKEVPGMKGARWAPFDITDAWCLASELRSGDAMLEVCDNCKCTYFTSVNQRTCVECPFCKEQGRHGGGEKECA